MTSLLRRLAYFEPARLQAVKVALVGLLTSLGITVSGQVSARIDVAFTVAAIGLPLLQGELTRMRVFSPASADRAAVQDPATAAVTVGAGDVAP